MQGQYSLRSPAVKRLMKEAQELREPTAQFHAQPLEDNLFEWHFTIRGPDESDFSGGIYHGRIILPPEYPMKPPSIIVLTSNGRFEVNSKICLSISGHHPESWQPSWSIRTAMLAIIGFMPTHGSGAIGSLDYSPEERKKLAKRSQDYKCPNCGSINSILRPVSETSQADKQEAKELASQINFQGEKKEDKKKTSTEESKSDSSSDPSTPPPSSPPFTGNQTPPWQMPWSPAGAMGAGMPRLPFMPFMRPPTSSAGNSMPGNPAAMMSHMAAMQAAWQQQMRAQQGMAAAGTRIPGINPISTAQTPFSSGSTESKTVSSTSETRQSSVTTAEAAASSATATTTSTTSSNSSTSAAATSSPSTEGARQRVATARVTTSTRSAEIPRRAAPRRPQSRQTSLCFNIVMIVVAVAFLLLLLRRLSIMGVIQYEQDDL